MTEALRPSLETAALLSRAPVHGRSIVILTSSLVSGAGAPKRGVVSSERRNTSVKISASLEGEPRWNVHGRATLSV